MGQNYKRIPTLAEKNHDHPEASTSNSMQKITLWIIFFYAGEKILSYWSGQDSWLEGTCWDVNAQKLYELREE